MPAIAAIAAAFLIGLGLRYRKGMNWFYSWAISCTVMPTFVLFAEFVLPYQGGGASMWPIALFFGSVYGAIAGAIGVAIGSLMRKGKKDEQVT